MSPESSTVPVYFIISLFAKVSRDPKLYSKMWYINEHEYVLATKITEIQTQTNLDVNFSDTNEKPHLLEWFNFICVKPEK